MMILRNNDLMQNPDAEYIFGDAGMSILSTFTMMMGDWDTHVLAFGLDTTSKFIIRMIFVFFVFFMSIVLFNAIIASE